MRFLDGITHSKDMSLSKPWEMVRHRKAWCAAVHGVTKNQTRLKDWKSNRLFLHFIYLFLTALGLQCCAKAFSSCSEWGLLLLRSTGSRNAGSVVVACRPLELGLSK